MSCPLCDHERAEPSWLGAVSFKGREFSYPQCLSCRSLYCSPMPDDEVLGQMYGPQYETSFDSDPTAKDPKEPGRVVEWLARLSPGTFVDYGCGGGELLVEAARLGWEVMGVEVDRDVADTIRGRTGLTVVPWTDDRLKRPIADLLHLGDVIEHLTDLNTTMSEIVRLIKPGGLLLAQGPLEGNANLFALSVRVMRWLRNARVTEMPPYHVLLATAEGQRSLFQRFGLQEREYLLREVSWPAPGALCWGNLTQPRILGLYFLRRLSQLLTAARPHCWGNRYFYVGRRQKPEDSIAESGPPRLAKASTPP